MQLPYVITFFLFIKGPLSQIFQQEMHSRFLQEPFPVHAEALLSSLSISEAILGMHSSFRDASHECSRRLSMEIEVELLVMRNIPAEVGPITYQAEHLLQSLPLTCGKNMIRNSFFNINNRGIPRSLIIKAIHVCVFIAI